MESKSELKQHEGFKELQSVDNTPLYELGLCTIDHHGICLFKRLKPCSGLSESASEIERTKDKILSECPYFCKVLGENAKDKKDLILEKPSNKTLHEVLTLLHGANAEESPEIYVRWATQLIRAVHFLHTHGFAHRKLNSTTIHFDRTNDISRAKVLLIPPSTFRGPSPIAIRISDDDFHFMRLERFFPPDVYADKAHMKTLTELEIDQQVDMYHLGLVLGQLFFRVHPLPYRAYTSQSSIWQALKNKIPPFQGCTLGINSKTVSDAIEKCCTWDGKARIKIEELMKMWDPERIVNEFAGDFRYVEYGREKLL